MDTGRPRRRRPCWVGHLQIRGSHYSRYMSLQYESAFLVWSPQWCAFFLNLREPRRNAPRNHLAFPLMLNPSILERGGSWQRQFRVIELHGSSDPKSQADQAARYSNKLCSQSRHLIMFSCCRASYCFCTLLRRLCWKALLEGFCFAQAYSARLSQCEASPTLQTHRICCTNFYPHWI